MSEIADNTVLVTGAGGFIGSHLTERLLAEGARVRAFVRYNSRNDWGALDWLAKDVRSEVEVILGDLRDPESVASAVEGSDYVCHLAAQIAIPYSYVNPRDFFETNVLGTLNVAQAALRSAVKRVVHTSTSEVYGTAQVVPITEEHPLHPQSPYAASKVAADKLIDSWHCSYELPVTTLRPFNTYGPRQSARAVIPTIIAQALAGGRLALGSLSPTRDLTFVLDTAEAFLRALTAPDAVGQTIQLGTGHAVSIGEIVDAVGTIIGRRLEVELDAARVRPDKSEVHRLVSSPMLAGELLSWTPQVDLVEGLRATADYIAEHPERYRADQYVI